jgi:hypothetical protein
VHKPLKPAWLTHIRGKKINFKDFSPDRKLRERKMKIRKTLKNKEIGQKHKLFHKVILLFLKKAHPPSFFMGTRG